MHGASRACEACVCPSRSASLLVRLTSCPFRGHPYTCAPDRLALSSGARRCGNSLRSPAASELSSLPSAHRRAVLLFPSPTKPVFDPRFPSCSPLPLSLFPLSAKLFERVYYTPVILSRMDSSPLVHSRLPSDVCSHLSQWLWMFVFST